MSSLIKLLMEFFVEARLCTCIGRALALRIKHTLQECKLGRVGAPGSKGSSSAFKRLAHIVKLGNGAHIERRYRQPALLGFDNALGLQTAQRLAHWCAANFKPVANFSFAHALSWLDSALLYGPVQGVINDISQVTSCRLLNYPITFLPQFIHRHPCNRRASSMLDLKQLSLIGCWLLILACGILI